jgi:hypothetical protein
MLVIVPESILQLSGVSGGGREETVVAEVAVAVTTEGGNIVTVVTTLGAAAAAVASCRVGAIGPMSPRVIIGGSDVGGSGGGSSGEVECVVPARIPGMGLHWSASQLNMSHILSLQSPSTSQLNLSCFSHSCQPSCATKCCLVKLKSGGE